MYIHKCECAVKSGWNGTQKGQQKYDFSKILQKNQDFQHFNGNFKTEKHQTMTSEKMIFFNFYFSVCCCLLSIKTLDWTV